jgi:hypothetical protein
MHPQGDGPPIEYLDRYLFTVSASDLSDQARRGAVRHEAACETLEEALPYPTI